MSWRQPKCKPSPPTTSLLLDRHRSSPSILGGRSIKERLGSVTDSWGPKEGEGEERNYGIFEVEDDPPSRSTSPFKVASEEISDRAKQENMRVAKEEALKRARRGTVYDTAVRIDDTHKQLSRTIPRSGGPAPAESPRMALDNTPESPSGTFPRPDVSVSFQPISHREVYKSRMNTSNPSIEVDTSTQPSPPSWLDNNSDRLKKRRQQLADMMAG
ncbi:MAG: hypothetical protein TREMPRED_005975 [Tremellales sp. Tagirdzhanova-0007]|nr:MAG: hypothetical protein TREMPRED_005975 [Tremellales sp. Tagirdzhanova-0007]